MGILNITPDSFSDGGLYLDPELALQRALTLYKEGVDVIDVGAQSTRPGAEQISSKVELDRLVPILHSIKEQIPDVILSIDTFHSKVAKECLSLGVDWINDISGGRNDPEILNIVSKYNCPYVLTHSRGNSQTMDKLAVYENVVEDVYNELTNNTKIAIAAGINPINIIWDPGIGFSKTTEQNIELIKNLGIFSNSGYPLLIGPSRKRFIGEITEEIDPLKRLWGTNAVVCKCVQESVDIVRVHDIYPTKKLLLMANKIWR